MTPVRAKQQFNLNTVAILVSLIVQLIGVGWWASHISTVIAELQDQQAKTQMKLDSMGAFYTDAEAIRDAQATNDRFKELADRVRALEERQRR